ncbi:MAG: GIY-YIG nuclease family protein [Flavobacterium sp.]
MEHFVYILYSQKLDRFYVGASENVEKGLYIHNNPIEGRKFTAKGVPWELKLIIPCNDKTIALKLERKIKNAKSRKLIQQLISNEIFKLEYLTLYT